MWLSSEAVGLTGPELMLFDRQLVTLSGNMITFFSDHLHCRVQTDKLGEVKNMFLSDWETNVSITKK